MKKIIFLFIAGLSSNLYSSTTYMWKNEKGQINTGRCYEVDKKTMGKKFSISVKKEFCKPNKTLFVFQPTFGVCTEIDDKTEGREYIVTVKIDHCRPPKTVFMKKAFKKRYGCFEVDLETKGLKFYKVSNKNDCENKGEAGQYFWKARSTGGGECFFSPENSANKFRVERDKCKPSKTTFRFERLGPLKGICYEEHPENKELYSEKTKLENCKPLKTLYVFYKEPKKQIGFCYEIDSETKGDQFIKKSKPENCK